MERLTERTDNWEGLDEINFKNPHDPEGSYNMRDIVGALKDEELFPFADRLAAYEDTGLTPEEIEIGGMSPICANCKGKDEEGHRTEFCDDDVEGRPRCVEQFKHLLELVKAEAKGKLVIIP